MFDQMDLPKVKGPRDQLDVRPKSSATQRPELRPDYKNTMDHRPVSRNQQLTTKIFNRFEALSSSGSLVSQESPKG